MDKTPITINGSEKLKEELKILKSVERPEVIAAIAEARAQGDLSENAEYDAAKKNKDLLREESLILKQSYLTASLLIQQNFRKMGDAYLERLLLFRILILRMRLNTKLLEMMKQILRKRRFQSARLWQKHLLVKKTKILSNLSRLVD